VGTCRRKGEVRNPMRACRSHTARFPYDHGYSLSQKGASGKTTNRAERNMYYCASMCMCRLVS